MCCVVILLFCRSIKISCTVLFWMIPGQALMYCLWLLVYEFICAVIPDGITTCTPVCISDISITFDIRIFWQKLVNFYVASESFPTWNVNDTSVVSSSFFPTINFFDPVMGQIFLEFGLNFRQGLLDPSHMIFHLFLTNLKKIFI